VPKLSRKTLYLLVGGVTIGAVAFLMTEPDPIEGKEKTRTQTRSASNARAKGPYTDEDYRASFAPLNELAKNAFKPLVARSSGSSGLSGDLEGGIPASFADGDPNWIFTGTAEVDGVMHALLENKSTGEGVFLRKGERWKRTLISQIGTEAIVFRGPDGSDRTIHIQGNEPEAFAPMRVEVPQNLRGAIGGRSNVRLEGSAPVAAEQYSFGDMDEN
jgi:hypothetical protein